MACWVSLARSCFGLEALDPLLIWKNAARGAPGDLPNVDPQHGPAATPRDVFAFIIHEGKIRAPAGAMALIERARP